MEKHQKYQDETENITGTKENNPSVSTSEKSREVTSVKENKTTGTTEKITVESKTETTTEKETKTKAKTEKETETKTEYYKAKENKTFTINERGIVKCDYFYCAQNNPDDIHEQWPSSNVTYQKIIEYVSDPHFQGSLL